MSSQPTEAAALPGSARGPANGDANRLGASRGADPESAPVRPGHAAAWPEPGSTASPERFAEVAPGVRLCYQTFGAPDGEPLLLVMGLGGPMTWWDPALCEQLAAAGFLVVRYDNRDTGRSSRMTGRVHRAHLAQAYAGRLPRPPYTLDDMAADGVGLLDHLGLDAAHVMGISMGGMIAQTLALARPDRVRSLVSVMSTTGRRTVGWQDPRLLPLLLARSAQDRDGYVASSVRMWRAIGSPAYPETLADVLARAGETFDRGVSASGVARQVLAILSQPDRSGRLAELRQPALVLHGLADKMVHVSGGRATARAIPGSELLLVPGMGHDLPPALYGMLVEAVRRTADRARG